MAQVTGRTIFAPVSKEDPKHGRWILPLVVLGLVVFTYTFVNNLPAAEPPTTTVVSGGTTTTTTEAPDDTTTTTTLAPEVEEFIATVDALSTSAAEMRATAQTINDEYDSEITGYGATRDSLSALRSTTEDFESEVGAVAVPTSAAEKWGDVTTAAAEMRRAADDMLDGLVNTSGPDKRVASLEDFNIAAATFDQLLDSVKELATEG